jgi:transketolase
VEQAQIEQLRDKARLLRSDILTMLHKAQSGHTGGSLSAIDIIAALYFHTMRHDPRDPGWEERDRFVLCKGHAAPALYVALAETGYFPREDLMTLRRLGSHLQGHPDSKVTPGVEVCTGSLGQGLSMAVGMALGLRADGRSNRVFALMGDGELQEGQVWEAAMAAAHYGTDNLCAIADLNALQIDGEVARIMNVAPVADKFRAFGWHVLEIDGHDMAAIVDALDAAKGVQGKPTLIAARTVKGKGVEIFENKAKYHGVPPSDDELQVALCALGCTNIG